MLDAVEKRQQGKKERKFEEIFLKKVILVQRKFKV